jgi:hypothetical protein
VPPVVSEISFGIVLQRLGIEGLSSEEQVKFLLELPQEELEIKTRGMPVPLIAVADQDVIHDITKFETLAVAEKRDAALPGLGWCKTIMTGACEHDVSVLTFITTDISDTTSEYIRAWYWFCRHSLVVPMTLQYH